MAIVDNSFEKVRQKMVSARIEFMSQLAKFSKGALVACLADGEWSPLQVAHHLYIADGVILEQMQQVQTEDNPSIEKISEKISQLTALAQAPVSLDAVLGRLAARREEIFEYLAALPAEAWERPYHSKEWGDRKFYQLANMLPTHDKQHAQQLAEMHAKLPAQK